jgi:hypothetical protein
MASRMTFIEDIRRHLGIGYGLVECYLGRVNRIGCVWLL